MTGIERRSLRTLQSAMGRIDPSEAVERFLGKYGNLQTKAAYSFALARYFEWLRESKSAMLTPDELLTDNLRCQANADPADIKTRKRHSLWLDDYVNSLLLERGLSDSKRNVIAAAVQQQFYHTSDSALFGSFEVSMGRPRPPALTASDIHKVPGALSLTIQLSLYASGSAASRSTVCLVSA